MDLKEISKEFGNYKKRMEARLKISKSQKSSENIRLSTPQSLDVSSEATQVHFPTSPIMEYGSSKAPIDLSEKDDSKPTHTTKRLKMDLSQVVN